MFSCSFSGLTLFRYTKSCLLGSSQKASPKPARAASCSASEALKLIAPALISEYLALTSIMPVSPTSNISRPETPISSKKSTQSSQPR